MFARATVTCALAVLSLVAPPAAVAASPSDPDLVDECGGNAVRPDGDTVAAVAPWHDVCAAWFDTVGGEEGPHGLAVHVTFAGDLSSRSPSDYVVRWRVGACDMSVSLTDDKSTAAGAASFGRVDDGDTQRRLALACPDETVRTCVLLGSCSDLPRRHVVDLPAQRVTEGSTRLSFVLLDSDLPVHRQWAFAAGATLRDLSVGAMTSVQGIPVQGSGCLTDGERNFCQRVGDQTGVGRAYTIAERTGEPILEPEACPSRGTGSAANPNIRDETGDHLLGGRVAGDEHDIVAVWASDDTISLLPAGRADVGQRVQYEVFYDGDRYVAAEGRRGGSWTFWHGVVEPWAPLGVPTWDVPTWRGAAEGSVDPATGLVTFELPGGVSARSLRRAVSLVNVPGGAGPEDVPPLVSAGRPVDETDLARACTLVTPGRRP